MIGGKEDLSYVCLLFVTVLTIPARKKSTTTHSQSFPRTHPTLCVFIGSFFLNSAFSCIESEFVARSLVTQVSQRDIQNRTYHLRKFGGVIITRADNDEINHIEDLKDTIIAAASISGLGSGQMEFREMITQGMSYINDPLQLVFTSDQGKVVHGVLQGRFDVGFIRTDQLERTKDEFGHTLNTSLFKVIDPKPPVLLDGIPFPFQTSTQLYPEWNVASLEHVPNEVRF